MGIRRSLAYLADFVLLTTGYILIFFALGITFFSNQINESPVSIILFYVFYLLVYLAYFCILPVYWKGFTLFKRSLAVKIKVKKDVKFILLLIVKYVVFRLLLTIFTLGLIVIFDMIYIKKHDGVSFVDKLLKIQTVIL